MFATTNFFLVGIFINEVFLNQEVKGGISKLLSENPSLVTAAVTTLTTIVLAFITWRYLRETRKMREIAYESLQLDASPKVFLNRIDTHQDINLTEKKLIIAANCEVTNVGKTEAKKPKVSYEVFFGNESQLKWELEPAPYIYPTQKLSVRTVGYQTDLHEQYLPQAKQAIEKVEALTLPQDYAPVISMKLNIKYFDHNDKEQNLYYLCDYRWNQANWGMRIAEERKVEETEEETESSESPQNQKGGQ